MKVYTVWAEWDLGINDNIFATYEAAEKALNKAIEENVDMTFEEARKAGLVHIKQNEVCK